VGTLLGSGTLRGYTLGFMRCVLRTLSFLRHISALLNILYRYIFTVFSHSRLPSHLWYLQQYLTVAMALIRALFLSLFVLKTTCIQFEIPTVENIVGAILATNDKYVHFQGNHSSSGITKRQSSSYWYENINHQGISAFGPSGYQVFRNVKSYGAKGTWPLTCINEIDDRLT
jgi:hypothetical protein